MNFKRPLRLVAWMAVATVGSIGSCDASPSELWIATLDRELITVDVATGQPTLIGAFSPILYDIAFSPSGELFGVTTTALYRLSTTTGEATLVGSLGLSSSRGINALTFGFDGRLLAAAGNVSTLYEVNSATGQATSVGSSGQLSDGDLAFDRFGRLLLSSKTSRIYALDPDSAAATLVGGLDESRVYGFARAPNGQLYGVADRDILAIDTQTGESNVIWSYEGSGVGNGAGAAFPMEATRPYLAGDFQFDGLVDAADLAVWQATYGTGGPFVAADGDFDGRVTGGDFLVWQRAFGNAAIASAGGGVPEPGGGALLVLAWAVLASRRGRPFLILACL